MFNRYLAAAVLCCSFGLAQADDLGRSPGFKFTAVSGQLTLSTLNCDTPYLLVYTLTNTGRREIIPTDIAIWQEDDDTLDPDAVTFVPTYDNDCVTGEVLGIGMSCNIGMSIDSCTAGNFDRRLSVTGENHGPLHTMKIAQAFVSGTVVQDETDSE